MKSARRPDRKSASKSAGGRWVDWKGRAEAASKGREWLADDKGLARANGEMVRKTVAGCGPDSDQPSLEAGARMVVNTANIRVPDFCRDGYKNAYDRGDETLGSGPASGDVSKRVLVDKALPVSFPPNEIYFGAVETTGTGIRFYGDFCLVLRKDVVTGATVILDRNSYD